MGEGISIDIGSALPYLEEKVLGMFGRDAQSQEIRRLLDRHLRLAIRDAAAVQVIGMDQPLSIFDIYQPTTLRRLHRTDTVDVDELVHGDRDAVVFGGPGRGKTILLHYLFASLVRSEVVTPLLFTLRRAGATDDLTKLVGYLSRAARDVLNGTKLLLLVDGLDEIGYGHRLEVAAALREFAAHQVGNFVLTCRSFYAAAEVQAEHLEVAEFTPQDSERFIDAFAKAYGVPLQATQLLRDLQTRGLPEFASHPLLLAMVCILKSGPMPELPHSTVELMRRALDTLTFRWDEARGIYRDSKLRFDGHDRLRCLVAIAFSMKRLIERAPTVERIAAKYLKLMHREDIDAPALLRELAQWYGILIPVGQDWTFVHRTLHDFCAAKCWVETGRFKPEQVTKWDSRAAYAACLQPAATRSLVTALKRGADLGVVAEILYNRPPFNADTVADAFASYFDERPGQYSISRNGNRYVATVKNDVWSAATDDLLVAFIARAANNRKAPRVLLAAYAFSELRRRGSELPEDIAASFAMQYGTNISFSVKRGDGKTDVVAV